MKFRLVDRDGTVVHEGDCWNGKWSSRQPLSKAERARLRGDLARLDNTVPAASASPWGKRSAYHNADMSRDRVTWQEIREELEGGG
jgi:hypothetical protein